MELEIYDAFRNAGIAEQQAKNIASTLNKAIEQHYAIYSQQLATQGDVEKVRAEVEKVRLETKAEIEKAKAEIIKWNIGAIFAAAGFAMAIARLFFPH